LGYPIAISITGALQFLKVLPSYISPKGAKIMSSFIKRLFTSLAKLSRAQMFVGTSVLKAVRVSEVIFPKHSSNMLLG
jgi:hypothetical protein